MDNEANKTMEEVQEVQDKEVSKDMAWSRGKRLAFCAVFGGSSLPRVNF